MADWEWYISQQEEDVRLPFVISMMKAASYCLDLGRVKRITYHQGSPKFLHVDCAADPQYQPESDTDHTVMLTVVACMFARKYLPQLDVGLIAQLATVHDFPEAVCGDTPTLRPLSGEEAAAKAFREQRAYYEIADEVGRDNWLTQAMASYSEQQTAEAHYVWCLDKMMPKATHLFNYCRTLLEEHVTPEELTERYYQQRQHIEERTRIAILGAHHVVWLYTTLAGAVQRMYRDVYNEEHQ